MTMLESPLPSNEAERLMALAAHNILDTPPEPGFDRLVRLAQRLFDVPVALLSLVDRDRQWFKARAGLDQEQVPRSISFCSYVVAQDAPMVVSDAAADPRFRANPMVSGTSGLRFYAGAPLRSRNGFVLGTLCIFDRVPRPGGLRDEQLQMLEDLADLAGDELELRRLSVQPTRQVLYDNLTGLPNRLLFEDRLQHQLFLAQREGRVVVVFLLDIEDFRGVNEREGWASGDCLLGGTARRLEHAFRAADTIARWGGDEFAALVTLDDASALPNLIRRLGKSLAQPSAIASPVACSVGVALYPDHGDDTATLLESAGQALQRARQNGQRHCCVAGSEQVFKLLAE